MPGRYFKKNADMADCFQTIIGLSDRDCDCFSVGRPDDTPGPAYNESLSGLFVTDLLPEEEIKGLESCDKTIWDVLIKARETAIKDFRATLAATMGQRYKLKYDTYKGFVGSDKYSDSLTSTYTYAGVRIRTAGIRSGYLKITRIMTMFSAVGTVTVTIYKARVIDEAAKTYALEVVVPALSLTTANGRAINTVNIELPLLSDFSDGQDYIVAYEYSGANKPKLNKVYCQPCSGPVTIDYTATNYPTTAKYASKIAWHNFILIGGWEGEISGGETVAPVQVSEYMNGLSLEVEAGCDMAAGLCGMVETFGSNPYAMSVATAIQRRTASLLMRKRLSSSLPNRNNAVNREGVEKELRTWEAEYAEILNYLSSNLPETSNDCMECKPRVRMGAILG